MCGICGFISNKNLTLDNLISMNNTLKHRGPDDHGEEIYSWYEGMSVGFAQRRLSIIDLSMRGHQPMHSINREVSIIFNGEIYNYKKIKNELADYPFQSDSDTEVLIAMYQKWGINFVERLDGMFAIALFDRREDKIYLLRDRIGKKPLYYHIDSENNIIFASELKAIFECPLFKKEINTDIIGRYLYRTYITFPETIYKNTFKLEPGGILELDKKNISKYKYWDVAQKYNEARRRTVTDYEEAKKQLEGLITESVNDRLVADVPVGAFLSGGYDSSLVCAIGQKVSKCNLKTFSIGFEEEKFNEAPYAKEIAHYLGTEHTELYITEEDMLGVIDSLPQYYDEPFADSSQIPTMLISKLAKDKVTVALTGDGGDELFGGYGIYSVLQKVQRIEDGKEICSEEGTIVDRILKDNLKPQTRTQGGVDSYFDTINRILIKKADNFLYPIETKYQEPRYDVRRMLLDMETSLPEDMLTKVDRASMRYALECRCPLLSRDILEYSLRLNPDYKVYNGESKKILKDITYNYIPKQLLDRPKMGFAIPQDKWLRTVLKERLLEFTDYKFLNKQDIFESKKTAKFIKNYIENGDQGKWSGQNYSRIVWSFFIFQIWYEQYEKRE